MKAHRRGLDDLPSRWPNFDGTPMLVGEIEIDVTCLLGDADMDRALGGIELRARLEQIELAADRVSDQRTSGRS